MEGTKIAKEKHEKPRKSMKRTGRLACIKMYSKTIAIWSVELMDKWKRVYKQTYIYGNKQKP